MTNKVENIRPKITFYEQSIFFCLFICLKIRLEKNINLKCITAFLTITTFLYSQIKNIDFYSQNCTHISNCGFLKPHKTTF